MTENNEVNPLVESLLCNRAFQRFAHGFEIIQEVIKENEGDTRMLVEERVSSLYKIKDPESFDDPQVRAAIVAYNKIGKYCLESSLQSYDFSSRRLAQMISELPDNLQQRFLELWNPKIGERSNSGHVMINELVSYEISNDSDLDFHIEPAPVSGKELLEKTIDGFKVVAKRLIAGEFPEVKNIRMASWLLNKNFEPKIKLLFGDDVQIEYLSEDDTQEDVPAIQQLAISYNDRSMRDFLVTGKKPEVGRLIISREKFLSRFGS